MNNPLSSQYSEAFNRELVRHSLDGNREALDKLVKLHQPFIYNVAWKMTHNPHDAMDLTQETLIKVITKMSQFNFKSAFRTWLYRIVVNEFLQSKKRKGEEQFSSLEDHGKRLEAIPNPSLTAEEEIQLLEQAKEMQFRCMSGMLMCLTREQRLIYLLGDTFGVDHNLGAEIFDISPQNYRVKLHRARKELYNFMNAKCGLVNKENPCRCPKKTKALLPTGILEKETLLFNVGYKSQITDFVVESQDEVLDKLDLKYQELFREHPAKTKFDKETVIEKILNDEEFMKYFSRN